MANWKTILKLFRNELKIESIRIWINSRPETVKFFSGRLLIKLFSPFYAVAAT